ncbi:polyketide synthase [Myxococcus xanthus]|uniref:Enoyl-CoA hydratase/isomerase n=1 Tax=Myxococcus fulvus TaxID=33 RepID=T1SF46_MYXFU|nr:polyketide synthase [Myxococcus xanthus]AGS77287.1 enoyl-CoA hydratase/isomerase [Myxococcus fulvus]QPM79764.1 enoyl-CoA hydratase/isomerase family protein [Myxococcus xanthus]QVV57716.1 MxnG [Vector pDPO-mxn116-Pvan-Tpase]
MNPSVTLTRRGAIGVVALEDRESRNTFSPAFVQDLKRTFDTIARMPEIHVVVVHGFDNYFCCGGTKEELIALVEGVRSGDAQGASLDGLLFYDLFLRCEVPVIAAMQGHAIGGGLALGLFADIVILAEESIYSAVFMKYGFTPGMGSTYILPKRMGEVLGAEMLFTARNYYGLELKARGAQVQVEKKAEVVKVALRIAAELAEKPRLSLSLLKAHLTQTTRQELQRVIAGERAMHRQSFAQPEVREKIEKLFGT